jgi:hypothetical protein
VKAGGKQKQALKMEAKCSSETSVDFQQITRLYIPENRTHNDRCDNLNSYIVCGLLSRDEPYIPGCDAVEFGSGKFWRNVLPPSSGLKMC